jgi:site-specific DNA-methyltransferase (adenine-specific)
MTLELNRIYNMDCLDGMRELGDKCIDLVITDPPYGLGARVVEGGSVSPLIKASNNDVKIWDVKIGKEYFDELFRISKNQIIWGGNYYLDILGNVRCFIIWDKMIHGNTYSDCELAWTSFDSPSRIWVKNIVDVTQDGRVHPTQKPVKLFEWIIKNYAKEGDTICDPFFGSGSCLVAAVRTGHPFVGFEKEKTYFDAAQIRIKKAQEQGKIGTWF